MASAAGGRPWRWEGGAGAGPPPPGASRLPITLTARSVPKRCTARYYHMINEAAGLIVIY